MHDNDDLEDDEAACGDDWFICNVCGVDFKCVNGRVDMKAFRLHKATHTDQQLIDMKFFKGQ